jgi:hypothetical protein
MDTDSLSREVSNKINIKLVKKCHLVMALKMFKEHNSHVVSFCHGRFLSAWPLKSLFEFCSAPTIQYKINLDENSYHKLLTLQNEKSFNPSLFSLTTLTLFFCYYTTEISTDIPFNSQDMHRNRIHRFLLRISIARHLILFVKIQTRK